MKDRPRLREALPQATILALATVPAWTGASPISSLVAAAAAALAGGVLGHRAASQPLRTWVVPVAAAPATGVVFGLAHLLARLGTGAGGAWPERLLLARDGLLLGGSSLVAAFLLAFLARRVSWLRVLPAACLVLAVAAFLAPHRGGAIHRPRLISDPAWTHGLHPGLLLALGGAAAALLAALGLYRVGRARWPLLQVGLVLALLTLLVVLIPSLPLLHFDVPDPLGLEGHADEDAQIRRARPGPGDQASNSRHGGNDPLGLRRSGGGSTDNNQLPFLDDYSMDRPDFPVGVVVLEDDLEPMGGTFYFRQVAFSAWNGRRLVRSFERGVDSDLFPGFPHSLPLFPQRAPDQQFRSELAGTVALLHDQIYPPVLADGMRIEPMVVADPALFVSAFRSVSQVLVGDVKDLLGRAAGASWWSPRQWQVYTQAPEDPRYQAVARQAVARLSPSWRDDPWAEALAVGAWLENNTRYSVRSKHAGARDPTASYLFGDRIGYCVHLAHAGALMLRSLGLPARVAGGYACAAEDRAGGSALMIRASSAHAWAEIYLDGVGWVPIDPSPENLDPPLPPPDLDLQRLLGELARPPAGVDGRPSTAHIWPDWRQWLHWAFLLAATLWLAGYPIKLWRRLAPLLWTTDRRGRLALRASLDRLAEAGYLRRESESWERFARRAAAVAPALPSLIQRHLAASFGRHRLGRGEGRVLARNVARDLAARGGWRRRLGWLRPWLWTRSR
ncbi:MAG TPA: transglutaminase family protein [Acidobacteria bacterium]|nr:transglutaminase family protein [Acidobacteriota bacterium]